MNSHGFIKGSIFFLLLFSLLPVLAGDDHGDKAASLKQQVTASESVDAIPSEVVPDDIRAETVITEKIQEVQGQIEKLKLEEIKLIKDKVQLVKSKSNLKWVNAVPGRVPNEAIVCAYLKNKPIYICRADVENAMLPGQLSEKGCLVTYENHSYLVNEYQLLTGVGMLEWKPPVAISNIRRTIQYYKMNPHELIHRMSESKSMSLPVRADAESRQPVYICRGIYENRIVVGRVYDRYCFVSDNHQVVKLATYEVLFAQWNN